LSVTGESAKRIKEELNNPNVNQDIINKCAKLASTITIRNRSAPKRYIKYIMLYGCGCIVGYVLAIISK